MQTPCNVGIYTRLSVDDHSNSARSSALPGESVSVENQRQLLTSHAHKMGWAIYNVYTDDGCSGGNSSRPAFQEMLADIRAKKVNLVLIKDLSRFGRNYIEVGMYTDFILPELGCSLVALQDNIDTSCGDNDMLPIRSLLNDQYLKDISCKIKASQQAMALAGKRVSGRSPYGYRIDPGDKHHFLTDPYAADIVGRIFQMRLQHVAYGKIAATLNSEEILSPRAYEYQRTGKPWPYKTHPVWLVKAVKDILRNPAYIGRKSAAPPGNHLLPAAQNRKKAGGRVDSSGKSP